MAVTWHLSLGDDGMKRISRGVPLEISSTIGIAVRFMDLPGKEC